MKNLLKPEIYFYYVEINVRWYLQINIYFLFLALFFYIVLMWQPLNTVNLVMLARVEIFKTCVTTNPALVCASHSSLSLRRHAHGPLAKRLMHMAHLSGNTSGVSKSSSDCLDYTGFPGDMCVAFFNAPPGNKDAVMPNPLTKEESRRVYNCDHEHLSGSTKRWIFKSMWNI